MTYFLGVCIGRSVVQMDIWSRIFAEKFRIILKVCVRTDKGKKGYQPNVDRSGQGRGRSKITENMRTFFMNGAKSQGSKKHFL